MKAIQKSDSLRNEVRIQENDIMKLRQKSKQPHAETPTKIPHFPLCHFSMDIPPSTYSGCWMDWRKNSWLSCKDVVRVV